MHCCVLLQLERLQSEVSALSRQLEQERAQWASQSSTHADLLGKVQRYEGVEIPRLRANHEAALSEALKHFTALNDVTRRMEETLQELQAYKNDHGVCVCVRTAAQSAGVPEW